MKATKTIFLTLSGLATPFAELIAALAILLLLLGPASAVELQLIKRITVDGDVVTLADVFGDFVDIGDAGEAIVARAPAPGKNLGIKVARIRKVARAEGLDWTPTTVLRSVTVTRSGRRISAAEIESAILDAIALDNDSAGLRVNLANRNPRFHVAMNAAGDLTVENIAYDSRTGRFSAQLVAAADTPDEVRADFRGRAVEYVELPVMSRRLKKGEIIVARDIEWLEWQSSRVPRDAVTDAEDLIGLAAGRTLRSGQPIRERDVNEPVVVAKGSDVRLVYRSATMVLTAGGLALEDGAMGSIIRVLNSQSKVVVEARVEGGNVLSVRGGLSLALN